MNLVKEYKGLKIFVSIDGEFYCDVINNSNDYKNKTFASEKLQSIEKAIDNFSGQNVNGNEYYSIQIFNNKIIPLKVTKFVGNRIFFDDGTDSSNGLRKLLYPKSIDKTQEFKDIKTILEQIEKNDIEIRNLYEASVKLRKEANEKLKHLPEVPPTLT